MALLIRNSRWGVVVWLVSTVLFSVFCFLGPYGLLWPWSSIFSRLIGPPYEPGRIIITVLFLSIVYMPLKQIWEKLTLMGVVDRHSERTKQTNEDNNMIDLYAGVFTCVAAIFYVIIPSGHHEILGRLGLLFDGTPFSFGVFAIPPLWTIWSAALLFPGRFFGFKGTDQRTSRSVIFSAVVSLLACTIVSIATVVATLSLAWLWGWTLVEVFQIHQREIAQEVGPGFSRSLPYGIIDIAGAIFGLILVIGGCFVLPMQWSLDIAERLRVALRLSTSNPK